MDAIKTNIFPSLKAKSISKDNHTEKISQGNFGELLKNSINEVNDLQTKAGEAVQNLVSGKEKDLHNTMIALQKAEVSFELIVQIQNKLMTAYDELKRMQI